MSADALGGDYPVTAQQAFNREVAEAIGRWYREREEAEAVEEAERLLAYVGLEGTGDILLSSLQLRDPDNVPLAGGVADGELQVDCTVPTMEWPLAEAAIEKTRAKALRPASSAEEEES